MHATKKLDALTSLRFFAAAMIVLGHGHRNFGSGGMANTLSLAQGVSFFFVLSGFILAYNYPLLASWENVAKFFKARFARIWPSHVAAIILMVILTGNLNGSASTSSGALFAGVTNLFLIQSVVPYRSIYLAFNGVAWSISTEMFFYLSFPLLIVGIAKGWGKKLTFLVSIVVLYVWFAVLWKIPADESLPQVNLMGLLYVNPLVRVLEFFMGVLACQLFFHLRATGSTQNIPVAIFTALEFLVLVLAIASMWFTPRIREVFSWWGELAEVVNFYTTKSGSAGVFTLLILVFSCSKGVISRALSWRPMVILGEISFAWYLVHTSVLVWYENNLAYFSALPLWLSGLTFWILSLTVAWLLHSLVENPFRKVITSTSNIFSRETLNILCSNKQVALLAGGLVLLLTMIYGPARVSSRECANSPICDQIVKQYAMAGPVDFDDFASLVGLRVLPLEGAQHSVELVFRIHRPLDGYKLAVHVVGKDSNILGQSDFLVNNHNVPIGNLWLERIVLPEAFTSPQAAALGLAMYKRPSALLPVRFQETDYDGHRALLRLEKIWLKKPQP